MGIPVSLGSETMDDGSNIALLVPANADGEADRSPRYAPCSAELAECTCPDFCERDHDND
jgi:hypothetical protein